MQGSHNEQDKEAPSDRTPPKTLSRRVKNRSKVWERVSWFKKRHSSSDNVDEASGSGVAVRVSGQSEETPGELLIKKHMPFFCTWLYDHIILESTRSDKN